MSGWIHSCASSMLQAYLMSFLVATLYCAYRGMLELDESCRTWPCMLFISFWSLWSVLCIAGVTYPRVLIALIMFGTVSLLCTPLHCSGTLTSLVKFALLSMFWIAIN